MRGSTKWAGCAELVVCAEAVPVVAIIPTINTRQERKLAKTTFIEVNRRIFFLTFEEGELD